MPTRTRTVLSCLVRVGGVNWTGDKCELSFVLSRPQGRQCHRRHRGRTPAIFGQPGIDILYPPTKFVIVVLIIVNSVQTAHIIWRDGWRKNASKCTNLHVTYNSKFSGGYSPNPHIGEGLWRLSPKPIPLGTSALRASPASLGASLAP